MLDAPCASASSSPAASIAPAGSASRRACSGWSSASRAATTCTCSSCTIIPNPAAIRCSARPCMISDASTGRPGFGAAGSGAACRPPIEANGPFDLLHAYQGMPAIVCAPIARRLGVPLVVTLDSGELTSIDDIGYGLQRRWFDRRARGVRAARGRARHGGDGVHGAAWCRPDSGATPVAVIPIGVDAARVSAGGARGRSAVAAAARRPASTAVKDYPTLLRRARAPRRPRPRRPPRHRRRGHDGRARPGADARRCGLESRVTFHGFQPTDRLAGVLRARAPARRVVAARSGRRRRARGRGGRRCRRSAPRSATSRTGIRIARWRCRSAIRRAGERDRRTAAGSGRGARGWRRPRASGRWRTTRTGPRAQFERIYGEVSRSG